MKGGLLERIQKLGHWRVVIRPNSPIGDLLQFQQCLSIVQENRVSIRGWDYPHLSSRQDESGGCGRGENYYESWCDWDSFLEFWRMFQSGQFLSYNAVHSDVGSFKSESKILDISDAIYTVTEFAEFSHRLARQGLYSRGYSISVSLRNTAGRSLSVGQNRMPFCDKKDTAADNLEVTRVIDGKNTMSPAADLARDILLSLFDAFGWNPDPNQIQKEQEAFYRREFR